MFETKAYAAESATQPLAPYQITRRDLGPHDVLIDILYCGICHTDVHQVRNEWGASKYPMVPGHEIVGTVDAVGPEVRRYKATDKVGVGCFVDSCRTCRNCREGLEQYCRNIVWTYNTLIKESQTLTFGGYSSRIVVDENYVLRIPASLPLANAAPLLCAGITTYSPLRHWKAGPGKKVAVVGLGGLGHMAVKIAKAMGARVTVLSHSMKKQQDAHRFGADDFYSTSDDSTFKKLAFNFDLVLNTVSAELDMGRFLELISRDGTFVNLGIPTKPLSVPPFALVHARRSLAGSVIGGIRETQEMLDFCAGHGISCDVEVIPIQKVNDAYDRLVKGDVKYRFVIDLASLK
jgi:uncharacterized zinc-type alcohol dehydrogenase-like protein